MKRKSVLRRLFTYYLLIMLVSFAALAWYTSRSIHRFYIQQSTTFLESRAKSVAEDLRPLLVAPDSATVVQAVRRLSQKMSVRISLFLSSGGLWVDSDSLQTPGGPGRLPEVDAALRGRSGWDHRPSKSVDKEFLFVAVPVDSSRIPGPVVRLAMPLEAADAAAVIFRWQIAVTGAVILLLALAISFVVARNIGGSLQELRSGAERFARGDLSGRMASLDLEEFAPVGEAMNEMARQLSDRVRTVTLQRNEQEAILASMVEGVLAVDVEERVMNLNRAAARLFEVSPAEARGRTIQEVVRNSDLQKLITQTLASHKPVEGNIVLDENGEQHLQAHGTMLNDAEGRSLGALLVFHDITQLKKLESVRRDFVANVSHELKTPITSIKGFVETLQDGAIRNPADAERFLSIISKHVERLNAIIEDLLALSRIELEAERAEIPLEIAPLADTLKSAVQACAKKAQEKSVQIASTAEPALLVRRNAVLLEQAVINLLDNAIKYSEKESTIEVAADEVASEVVITVTDHGCGIGKEHLPRLWERFYRVDRARSRTLGGTGLGLAIVKHIVLAHGGRVSVESELGRGSTFRIHLPAVKTAA